MYIVRATILYLTIILAFLVGSAAADSRVMYVDGDGDGEVSVFITNCTEYEFGIWDGTDFDSLLDPYDSDEFYYLGGDVLNYALDYNDNILTLANDDAFVDYFGPITGTDYYAGAYIRWNLGTEFPNFTIDVVTSSALDGVKPVPIPASVLLLGSGILGLIAIGRVKRRDS